MSDAERRIWYFVRAGRFAGRKFRRQVPVGPFVADFLCESAMLIVEVDGGQHDERRHEDQERTRWLVARGYRVVRFWNNDVMANVDGVLETLSRLLNLPSPQPSPKGEGDHQRDAGETTW